jgi:DNA invertase Pin-like site-specific DNA recombinase
MDVAYSYIRFSSAVQERGDSIRRQTELRDRWLARHPNVPLDESLTLADLGVSAFRGKHRADDRTALGQFLRAVEDGRVKRGSYLLVESLDRLTREELGDAFELILGLVNRGVRIVQLHPTETILQKPVNMASLMLAVVELSRGNSESQMKSVRVGAAWKKKREDARSTKKIMTPSRPDWLEFSEGRFHFKAVAKAIIRRIYRMSAAGMGYRTIARELNAAQVPHWKKPVWTTGSIRNLIRSRGTLGEVQPGCRDTTGKPRPDGDPIEGYYPAAVSPGEWHEANAAADARHRRGGGRPHGKGGFVNIWSGLLKEAGAGGPLHVNYWGGKVVHGKPTRSRQRVYMSGAGKARGELLGGLGKIPVAVFDRLILSKLTEIKPKDLFPDEGPDDVADMRAQLARLDAQMRALTNLFDGEEDVAPEVAEKLKKKHAERVRLAAAVTRAERGVQSPARPARGEFGNLVEALDSAKDEGAARTRLRSLIARAVERVDALFVSARGELFSREKGEVFKKYLRTEAVLVAVQIRFLDGTVREFAIFHRARRVGPKYDRPEHSGVKSFNDAGFAPRDLRDPAAVAKLEPVLRSALLSYCGIHSDNLGAVPLGTESALTWSVVTRRVVTRRDPAKPRAPTDDMTLTAARSRAAELMKAYPTWSDRRIGEAARMDHKTIGKLRRVLIQAGAIQRAKTIEARDGRKCKPRVEA